MIKHNDGKLVSAVFITFPGNCKKALTFYQSCFGGTLHFQTFRKKIPGYTELPVVRGSLVSECLIIHGSDLVHNEGRKIGNYISLFLQCKNSNTRKKLINKLEFNKKNFLVNTDGNQKLIEVTDAFEVKWLLSI